MCFNVLSMMPFHNYLLISNFMISVALLFLWLKKYWTHWTNNQPLQNPSLKAPIFENWVFWDVLISKFINYCLCPLRKYSILEPVLWHKIKNHITGAHLYCHYQKLHCCYAKNIPDKSGRCALSQSCCVLPKAQALPQAELFEGLEPLLFATYKEYGKWINRLSSKTENV